MRFIDNGDLRHWVQENLQRKLIQQAHELAVQTGCEVLLRLQETHDSQQCKYYITDGLKEDYTTHGVRLAPGDQPMSGESGLPKKFVHDFTCQVVSEPIVLDENETARTGSSGTPAHEGHQVVTQGHQASGEWDRIYMDRLWRQQVAASASPEVTIHREAKMHWAVPNGLRPFMLQARTSITSEGAFPVGSEVQVPLERNGDDDALWNLKKLHMRRFMQQEMDGDGQTRSPHEIAMAAEREYVQIMTSPDHPQRTEEHLMTPRQEPPAPHPPPAPTLPLPPLHQPAHDTQGMVDKANVESQPPGTFNSTQQSYLCRICERTFCDLYTLVSHAKMFHSSIPELIFVCNTCKASFEDARSLHNHLGTHGDLAFYTGAACQLKTLNRGHQRLVHQRRFPCPECGKMFSRFGFMQSHIERVHGGTHISASMDTTALSKDTVITHREQPADSPVTVSDVVEAGPSSEKLFQCLYCHERFGNVDVFQEHVKEVHLGLKSNSMSVPPPFTENIDLPAARMRSKSENLVCDIGKEVFKCQECGKEFPRGKLLQNHVNRDHIPSNFMQGIHQQDSASRKADDSYTNLTQSQQNATVRNIESHEVHTTTGGLVPKSEPSTQDVLDLSTVSVAGEVSLPPSDDSSDVPSDYPSRSPTNSDNHMQEATCSEHQDARSGEIPRLPRKRFACDVCGKTYKYGFHMKEHRLTHAAVCPFVCRMCGMGFFRQRQLRDHELRHSGAYPCRCEICGKGFPRTSELKRHMAFRHRRLEVLTRQNPLPSPSVQST